MTDTYSVIIYPAWQLPNQYLSMVYSKWLRSLRYGNDYFKLISPAAYYESYHKYLELLLSRHDCVVRLAVLTDDPDVVLGFSVARGSTLDYVHVQRDMRRMGVGTALLPPEIEATTHVTKPGLAIMAHRYSHWKFDPFK